MKILPKVYRNYKSLLQWDDIISWSLKPSDSWYSSLFGSTLKVQNRLHIFEYNVSNPTVRVLLSNTGISWLDDFAMLTKYGSFVEKIEVIMVDPGTWINRTNRNMVYSQLVEVITKLRNVTTLTLRQASGHIVDAPTKLHKFEIGPPINERIRTNCMQALKEQISLTPFPNLKTLHTLHTQDVDPPLLTEILQANRQLKNLECIRNYFLGEYRFEPGLRHLKSLKLRINSTDEFSS